MTENRSTKEVVILLTDMVQYSTVTQNMSPDEICDFIVSYYNNLETVFGLDEFAPATLEPLAGDGSIIIFEKRDEDDIPEVCTRALDAALACQKAIDNGRIPATRMGLFLGDIIETQLKNRLYRFGSSFAVASRIEELCGYYDVGILMDREMARNQRKYGDNIVSIGKVIPKNFTNPYNLFSVILPGYARYSVDLDRELLTEYLSVENEAVDLFFGNQLTGEKPDFPKALERFHAAQDCHVRMTGRRNIATDRNIDYIREYPFPMSDFKSTGIQLGTKTGNDLGLRLFHLSKQLFRAIDENLYNALIQDTEWEQYFKLDWCEQGDVIIRKGDSADGIYYIDRGFAHAENERGETIATFKEGSIFGEMAYFNKKEKVRNANVVADSMVVLRKVSHKNIDRLPVLKELFHRLAQKRIEDAY